MSPPERTSLTSLYTESLCDSFNFIVFLLLTVVDPLESFFHAKVRRFSCISFFVECPRVHLFVPRRLCRPFQEIVQSLRLLESSSASRGRCLVGGGFESMRRR